MMALNFSMLSLIGLGFLTIIDPENSIKMSFCHFSFNIILSIVSLVAPEQILKIVESSLPFKTSIVGVLCFTLFQTVPGGLLRTYDILVSLIEPIYSIFEVLQAINIAFVIARIWKRFINLEQNNCQISVILALATSIGMD